MSYLEKKIVDPVDSSFMSRILLLHWPLRRVEVYDKRFPERRRQRPILPGYKRSPAHTYSSRGNLS